MKVESDLYRCECPDQFTGDFCDKAQTTCIGNECEFGPECHSAQCHKGMTLLFVI